jgi:hypothetical protein
VHFIDEGIDTGDIILQKIYPITDNDDYSTLLAKAYEECGKLLYESIKNIKPIEWILEDGTLANSFPSTAVNSIFPKQFKLQGDIVSISENFNNGVITGMFEYSGLMIAGNITTIKTQAKYEGNFTFLKDLIQNGEVADDFYISNEELDKWKYLKGPKKETRKNANGYEYNYFNSSKHILSLYCCKELYLKVSISKIESQVLFKLKF